MNDVETELREMLHRRAGDSRPEPDPPPRVMRRARRRRAVAAAVAGVTAAVVVAGAVIGVQAAFREAPAPGHHGPAPTPSAPPGAAAAQFPGIWPESNRAGLAAAQRQVNGGADPWRLGSEPTAHQFAVRVMRWSPAEIRSSTQVLSPSAERINVWSVVINKEAGLPLTEGELGTTITVAQLGRTGGGGIWSVTDVRSSVLTFRVGPQGRNGCPVARLAGGKPAGMCGRVAPLFPTLNPRRVAPAGANFVAWKVYVGPNADIVQGEGNLLGGGFDVVQGRFGGGLTENFPRNATVLLVELLHQPGGKVVGAEALRLNLRRG